ncbi:hypothetical protein ACQ4PT_068873 [Festuca glaucescens]
MEVSVRLRPPPAASTAPPRHGRGSLGRFLPSARPVPRAVSTKIRASAVNGLQRSKSNLEKLFCYDKSVSEEDIGKPTGLYVDSIMESQGIIIKVRCLGCGGTGNIMCSECGGRGHT